jgi:hypothetical protein
MEQIVIELNPAGGWNIRIPGRNAPLRAASRRVAHRLAREQQRARRGGEIIVRDAYHRVMRDRHGAASS